MTWQDIARDPDPVMPLLRRRFPRLRAEDIRETGGDSEAAAARLARAHDLTIAEAREQLDDTLFEAELRRRRREGLA